MNHVQKNSYLKALTELEKAVSEGDITNLKKLSKLIDTVTSVKNQAELKEYYGNNDNPVKNTNLVILACKYNKTETLQFLFNKKCKILNNLSVDIARSAILPDDEDELCHNAFYYAIRANNVDLLDTLIIKWPGNYFAFHLEELDAILARAYEDLKLKNVPLSSEMEIFVENKLINLRFFSDTSRQDKNVKNGLNNIRERIKLILENIDKLNTDYSNTEVDEKFLFISKFIAINIHVLKRQLKSTYDRLPWEEIEFCLLSFISSYIKQQEINLFYNVMLNKTKILKHLKNFARKLENEKGVIEGVKIGKLAILPKLQREKVTADIITSYPQLEELYKDYQQIRDIHSLQKISNCVKLALSSDPKKREGQLVITRVLQNVGEFLKNTLESPKLSNTTTELLLLSLPKNTRKIVMDLRNSLSHVHSLSNRTEIEANTNTTFFTGIQNDIKRIEDVISDIFYNSKIKMIRILLQRIADSKNWDEMKEVAEILSNVKLDEQMSEHFKTIEHEKLENLIKKLGDSIINMTDYEKGLFDRINNLINSSRIQSKNLRIDFITGLAMLQAMSLKNTKIDHNIIRGLKFSANQSLQNITPQFKAYYLKEIAELSVKISFSVTSRTKNDTDEVMRICYQIFYMAQFEMGDIKWIEKLREKLNGSGSIISAHKKKKTNLKEQYQDHFVLKITELKNILSNNGFSDRLTEKMLSYKSDKKFQAVVEMLVLDIMSILGIWHSLEDNLLFLDDYTPLLIGKCLRNHLAHDNFLIDVLCEPSIAVFLNAKKLTEENIIENKKNIGKLVNDDLLKLKEKYEKNLDSIKNQERMFDALAEGNLEIVKDCLKKGADSNARNVNLWSTLHFAAKGPSLEVVKFIVGQNINVNMKTINGDSCLHIAATHGRKNIVEFLIKEAGLCVDNQDNISQTPLHIAAQKGHKDVVEDLLKYKAKTDIYDLRGMTPLHCAIINNHLNVAKILMEKDINVDINETLGGYTPLHGAAERGHLEIVNFLLQNKANVNASTERNWIPLHGAALNGHLEIVNVLISKGADVNARVIDGCTPLHYAVENGHEKIANILLKHGANVDTIDKTYYNTPLHYAAKDGHEGIVEALLKNKANACATTIIGITPLHFAAQSGHLRIVTALLEHGVDICARDVNNATPLHFAVQNCQNEVVELLIKNSADINAKTFDGTTPLHVAAIEGHETIVDLLIRNKARIDNVDNNGDTPLHAAASNGSIKIIDLLLQNQAKINARNHNGFTSLHEAAQNGHSDAIKFLIQNKADVNSRTKYNGTPLHSAVAGGHKDVVDLLIENKSEINSKGIEDITPLHLAVEGGYKEIVEMLVVNGANLNVKFKNQTALLYAIKNNNKEIVEVLVANGADVNLENGEPLSSAIMGGYSDIVEILLENEASVNVKYTDNEDLVTPLHLAAMSGKKPILNALITRGADVNAMGINKRTPLHVAAHEDNEELVEILIANGADVNVVNDDGTALHLAASFGNECVVEVLLKNGAKFNIRDIKSRTPLELAVARGHLKVVKILLQYNKDVNAKGKDDLTILHIASQQDNLEIVKYLVDNGCDINAENAFGAKPIHIAAREGYKDTTEFFLGNGSSIHELNAMNQTLLHYAAMKGHVQVVNYLIAKNVDVNAQDCYGSTPVHIAADYNCKDVIEILLKNGAFYNVVDSRDKKPLNRASDENTINMLAATEKLFEAVKRNDSLEVENYINAGAIVDAKNSENGTPLHYAAWKGYDEVVNVLLKYKANPNVVGNKQITPLHYAAKFSHLKIVKALLSNGAIYDAVSESGKTPLDFVVDKSITSLLKLVSESFKNVKNDNSKVIDDLNKIKDIDTIKAVMCARNKQSKTLIVVAIQNDFSNIEQLKQVSQGDICTQVNIALLLLQQGDYQKASNIFQDAFEKGKKILGSDNPATLDIQTHLAKSLYALGAYQKALNASEEIFQKQKDILGLDNKDTLNTRSVIALILHRLEKNEESYNIFREVYPKQKEILGPNDVDTLNTQFHMALVLAGLGKYEQALNINKEIYEIRKKELGINNGETIRAQNNIAMVLAQQGKSEEALEIYKKVLEKKILIFGIDSTDTLRTMQSIAQLLAKLKKYRESEEAFENLLNIQKKALGSNHPHTLTTQYMMGNLFFVQFKYINAFRIFKLNLNQMYTVFGPFNPYILDITKKLEVINLKFKLQGNTEAQILQYLETDIKVAASNGDIQTVHSLLKDGADVNDKDIEGRTPLHFAASNGHLKVVELLLTNKANITQVTKMGNTPLHIAVSKKYKEIVEVLLQFVNHNKVIDLINAKTVKSGATSLHVAAKNGYLDIVKSLLKRGAIYNINNNENKSPFDLSTDQNVSNLLKLVKDFFDDAKDGNTKMISRLKSLKNDELMVVTNARNNLGNTILQVAIANKHKNIASKLLERLKNTSQN